MFKHIFWVAPVACIAMYLAFILFRENSAKIDVQQPQIHATVNSILAQTTKDPRMKKLYMKNMSAAQDDERAARGNLKSQTETVDRNSDNFNKEMKEVDKQLSGGLK